MRPLPPAGRLIWMCTKNGARRSTRLRAPLPLVKKTILVTRAFFLPFGLRTVMCTPSLPPAGVQRMPVSRLTSPGGGGGGGGAGGGGTAIGPKSCQAVQPVAASHTLTYISSPLRVNRNSRLALSPSAAGEELCGALSSRNQLVQPFTASQWFW